MNESEMQAMLQAKMAEKMAKAPSRQQQTQSTDISGVHGKITPNTLPKAVNLDKFGVKLQVDLRNATRFSEKPNEVGISGQTIVTRRAGLLSRWSRDPLEKFIHESTKPMDQMGLQKALFDIPAVRPNFSPIHEILNKRAWEPEEKAVALRHVLEYGLESIPGDSSRGLDRLHGNPPCSAIQLALEKRNLSAVNILVEAGASTSLTDSRGYNPMAYAALNGMPDAMPTLMSRTGAPWTSRTGETLMDLSFKRLESQASFQPPHMLVNEIETFYKSLATIKQFRMEAIGSNVDRKTDPEGIKEFNNKLDIIAERFDSILATRQMSPFSGYFKVMLQQVKDMQALESDEISQLVGPKSHRAFTNPNKGINDVQSMEYYKHPWIVVRGLFAPLDIMSSKLDRANAMQLSESSVYFRMKEMPPGKGTPEYEEQYGKMGEKGVEQYSKTIEAYKTRMVELERMRPQMNLDLVVTDFKDLDNVEGDTLLTKAIRTKNYDLAETFMALDVNMHARDAQGQTPMHILAQTCNNKADFINMITGLVGRRNSEGGRQSMHGHGNTADWNIQNNEGQTFLDVLQKTHPEWVKETENHLGVKNVRAELPEWSMTQVLALGGPEKVLALALSTVPTLESLPETALPSERRDHTDTALNILNNVVHQMEQTKDQTKSAKLMGQLDTLFTKCDATTKMGLVMGLMKEGYDLDSPQREAVLLQAASGLARDISAANPAELEKMFNLSNEITDATESVWKSQELATHMIVQAGISMGNTDLQELGQVMEKRLREVAAQKYSANMDNEHAADGNFSGAAPSKT